MEITVIASGGVVQGVENIPPGITVNVLDYDIEGVADADLTALPDGSKAYVATYEGPSIASQHMPTRNTEVLRQIVEAPDLQSPEEALARLEHVFEDKLLVVAGDVESIDQQAQELRLAITTEEVATVLDHIAQHHLAAISIETAEEVINALFPDRFIEP